MTLSLLECPLFRLIQPTNASAGRLGRIVVRISPEFAEKVYDTLTPGATIIVTDEPAVRKASRDFTILAD